MKNKYNLLILSPTKMELPKFPKELPSYTIGVGKKKAEQNARKYITETQPALVILVGLAGGVDPALKNGDIFIPETISDFENPSFQYKVKFSIYRSGTLITVPRIFWKCDKEQLVQQIPYASAVDMEASSVAKATEELGTKLLCIKGISDDLNFDLKDVKRLRRSIKIAITTYTEFLWRLLIEKFHVPEPLFPLE